MKKLLVILGPTSTGKTDLALYLAKKFDGELVACDSRQVYRGLDVVTGKVGSGKCKVQSGRGKWIVEGVVIHMYDVADLSKQFSVYNYVKQAEPIVHDISKRGKLPIIVGGTGLYLKGLLKGFSTLSISLDEKLREELSSLSLVDLQERLKKLDINKWNGLNDSDKKNRRRLTRSTEIVGKRGELEGVGGLEGEYDVLKVGLNLKRELLYERIDQKVRSWIDLGMLKEVEDLQAHGITLERLRAIGLNYKAVADYLEGKITLDEMTAKMQAEVRRYAKRQITWFKKESGIFWFDVSQKNFLSQVENKVRLWYDEHGLSAKG